MNIFRATLVILCTFFSAYNTVRSEDIVQSVPETNIVNNEVKDAVYDLQNRYNEVDRPFIKYLSTYALVETKRDAAALTGSFVLHSLIGPAGENEDSNVGSYHPLATYKRDEGGKHTFVPVKLVPGSKTLWAVDIRDFNFTLQAWEKVAAIDPYFAEPTVRPDVSGLLRLLSGNSVLRMDWFIYHATDVDQELAAGRTTKIYETLLYSNVKEPKTVKEFETIWGIDIKKARQIGNESLTVVTKSKGVAQHNRILAGYRTELGWYYRSYDVLNQEGIKDYVESIYDFKGKPPAIGQFDAGELIATNAVKLQVYGLNDAAEKMVDTADSRVVRHPNDFESNPTVRISVGCHSCHAQGPTPAENTISEFIRAGMKLYVPNKGDALRIDRAFLDRKFEEQIDEDVTATSKVMQKVNGLSTLENGKNYVELMTDYGSPLSLEDICRECGATPEQIKKAAEGGLNTTGKVPARLGLLLATGEPIPRNIWDSPGKDGRPGTYQQTMSLLYGYIAVKTEVVAVTYNYKVIATCDIMNKQTKVASLPKDTILKQSDIGKVEGDWVQVNVNGKSGYIQNSNLLRMQ